jgi:hypothetical protein
VWTKRELVRLLGFDPFKPEQEHERWRAFELQRAFVDELRWWDDTPRLRVVAA